MLKVDKRLKVDLHAAVLLFCLAINLRIKSCREPPFDANKIAKQSPELGSEQQASIRNNWIGQAIVPNYHVKDDLG